MGREPNIWRESRRIRVACMYVSMKKGGGAEQSTLSLVRGLDRERFEPYLVLHHRVEPEHDLSDVKVLDCGNPAGRRPWWLETRFASRVARNVRRLGIDILHSHMASLGGEDRLALWAGRLRGAKIVRTCRRQLIPQQSRLGLVAQAMNMATDAYTVVSPDLVEGARRIARTPLSKISVIPNGIELERFAAPAVSREDMRHRLGVHAEQLLVLAVGRLSEEKDYPTLVAAFAQARADLDGAALLIAGEGVERARVTACIRQHGLGGEARLLGRRDDVPDLLGAADLLVMSSTTEGFGRSAAEAMAAGLPVVATDVSGLRYVLDEGRAGLLVPAESAVSMAEAIRTLARDPDLRRELAEKGRKRAFSEFSAQTMVRRYEKLYLGLIARRGAGR